MKLLKFYASWCQPCKGLTMVINGAKDKIEMPIEEIDIDQQNDMALKYQIRSIPVLVIVDDSGNEVKRNSGMLNETQLLDFLKV